MAFIYLLLLSFPCLTRKALFTTGDYPVKLDNDRDCRIKYDNDIYNLLDSPDRENRIKSGNDIGLCHSPT